jgi:Protein of unknown function (DUF3179)
MTRTFVLTSVVAAFVAGVHGAGGQAAPERLPYAAVHDPQFVSAADATFMRDDDRLIGVTSAKDAKAYPAAILSQHGLVEDRSPSGPIAVTW